MKIRATTPTTAPHTGVRYSYRQSTAADIGRDLYRAQRLIEQALAKAEKLSTRKKFAPLIDDLGHLISAAKTANEITDAIARGD
jgi:hypothetical protein